MSSTVTQNRKLLADQFQEFHQALTTFVEQCSDADWAKITPVEKWPVGVTARHIAVGHYPLYVFTKMIVEGEPLPDVTMAAINQANDQHAVDHADCTKAEVTQLLHNNFNEALSYLNSCSDEELARSGYFALFDKEFGAGELFDLLLVEIADGHLQSMKAAVAT